MELPLLIFSKTNIDSSPGHSGTCSASLLSAPSSSAPTREDGAEAADSLGERHAARSLPRRVVNEAPPHSKGLLNSKFILHREEERIRHKL